MPYVCIFFVLLPLSGPCQIWLSGTPVPESPACEIITRENGGRCKY